jgi:hypothetical protein
MVVALLYWTPTFEVIDHTVFDIAHDDRPDLLIDLPTEIVRGVSEMVQRALDGAERR